MSIKICATNKEKFCNIEEAINKIDNEFVNRFNIAEYVLDRFNTINLIAEYNGNKIELPSNFIIKEMSFKEHKTYDKKESEIVELVKYIIEIIATYVDKEYKQDYKLTYLNLYSINTFISIKK